MPTSTPAKKTAAKKTTPAKKTAAKKTNRTANDPSAEQGDEDSMLMELLVDSMKDIYWAEKALTRALKKMQKESTSEELQNAFADHLSVTETQITRLEKGFELLGEKAQAKKCDAMQGLIQEAEGMIEDTEKGSKTRDVALIMAAQKVEHYEIATYGSLRQLADTIGNNELSGLMQETLDEEKEADELLTSIAENNINEEASEE